MAVHLCLLEVKAVISGKNQLKAKIINCWRSKLQIITDRLEQTSIADRNYFLEMSVDDYEVYEK